MQGFEPTVNTSHEPDKISSMVEYFRKPGKQLKLFTPSEEKLLDLADKFYIGWLWLPDDLRTKTGILGTINFLFPNINGQNQGRHVYYEIGDWHGMIGFCNITPEYKADLFIRVWDRSFWGPTAARDIKKLLYEFMRGWGLRRLSLSTPDIRTKNFAEFLGLQVEGTQKYGFVFDQKFYTNYLLRKLL